MKKQYKSEVSNRIKGNLAGIHARGGLWLVALASASILLAGCGNGAPPSTAPGARKADPAGPSEDQISVVEAPQPKEISRVAGPPRSSDHSPMGRGNSQSPKPTDPVSPAAAGESSAQPSSGPVRVPEQGAGTEETQLPEALPLRTEPIAVPRTLGEVARFTFSVTRVTNPTSRKLRLWTRFMGGDFVPTPLWPIIHDMHLKSLRVIRADGHVEESDLYVGTWAPVDLAPGEEVRIEARSVMPPDTLKVNDGSTQALQKIRIVGDYKREFGVGPSEGQFPERVVYSDPASIHLDIGF